MPRARQSSERLASSRRRAVTARGDRSTPRSIGDSFVALARAISRRRAVTTSGVIATTVDLLQPLDVDDVLRAACRQLQGDEACLRDDGERTRLVRDAD